MATVNSRGLVNCVGPGSCNIDASLDVEWARERDQQRKGQVLSAHHATVDIDLEKLRQAQEPDIRGQVFLLQATGDQLAWFEEQPGSLVERAEIRDTQSGLFSSFSCAQQCCGLVHYSSYMSPGNTSDPVGSGGNLFLPMEQREDPCTGILYGPYDMTSSSSWSSNNTGVATVSTSGYVNCLAPGRAGISAQFTSTTSYQQNCAPVQSNLTTGGGIDVTPVISSLSPAQGLIGTSLDVTISGKGLDISPSLKVAGTGITATIKSLSGASITATFAIASNATAGNHAVTVTSGGQSSNSKDFLVQVPTSLKVTSVAATQFSGVTATGCPSAAPYGVGLNVSYQILDQQNPAQPIRATMQVKEDLLNFVIDGQTQTGEVIGGNITPSGNSEADGSFADDPIGVCEPGSFSVSTFEQRIHVIIGSSTFNVRLNDFTLSGSQTGCGNMTNSVDINFQKPCN